MKKTVFLFVISLFVHHITAQNERVEDPNSEISYKGFSIGITPSSWVNSYPALQFSVDYGFVSWASITNEIGWIPDTKKIGYRWRPGILFHAIKGNMGGISLGIAYNERKAYKTREVQILRAQGQFTEKVPSINEYGLKGLVGQGYVYLTFIPHLYLRFGMGLGTGIYESKNISNQPFVDNNIFRIRDGRRPILYFHFNTSYHFSK